MIEVKDIVKIYDEKGILAVTAVDGIDLSFSNSGFSLAAQRV